MMCYTCQYCKQDNLRDKCLCTKDGANVSVLSYWSCGGWKVSDKLKYLTGTKENEPVECVAEQKEDAQTTIKDSGDRTKFSTGAVRDMHEGKGRMDLLPWNAIIEVSKHCEKGAKKYGEHNVDMGIPLHSLLDSGIRHTAKFIVGMEDEAHLTAAVWNMLWALEMYLVKPDMVDIPYKKRIEDSRGDT